MLYEVCSYQLGHLRASETFKCFNEANRAYQDWCFTLSADQVVIWEQANGELCEETPEATIIRQASIVDKEDGTRLIIVPPVVLEPSDLPVEEESLDYPAF